MDDWMVYLLCGVVFVFGLSVLFFSSPDVSPQELVISGEVVSVVQKEDVNFITFVPDDFLVVSFDEVPPEGEVSLIGRLQDYGGRVEFVVSGYMPRNSDISGKT